MTNAEASRIVYVNFFPRFTPPHSGGEQRYYYLTHHLARDFSVQMVNCTFPEAAREVVEHDDGVIETRVPKTRRAVWFHRLFDRIADFKECSGLVVAMTCGSDRPFRRELAQRISSARIVVVAAPFVYPAVRSLVRGKYLVYDSYNVEYLLHHNTLSGDLGEFLNRRYIRRWERRLARDAHMIWACSAEDAAQMTRLYGADPLKLHLIPNGIDTTAIITARSEDERSAARAELGLPPDRPMFLFLGSLFTPNIESADFIVTTLAPQYPGADFYLAGKVCDHLRHSNLPPNVRVMGLVPGEVKQRLYSACTAALNPVFSGSGTSLKMLEFFASGLPVITTPLGARGLDAESGRHAMIGEAAQFPGLLRAASTAGAERLQHLGDAARRLVENRFSWNAIGRRAADLLRLKTQRRIVILNDFPTGGRRHGGQIHLYHMARQAAREGNAAILVPTRQCRPQRIEHSPTLEEIIVERSPVQVLVDQVMGRLLGFAADDVNMAIFWRLNRRYLRLVRREAACARVVICSHPYLAPLARSLGLPIIYNSHNVEADLKDQMLPGGPAGWWLRRQVRRIEGIAARHSAWMTAISESNRRQFIELYGISADRIELMPNGVDCASYPVVGDGRRATLKHLFRIGRQPVVLFTGSGHPPNREAAEFINDTIAPALPDVLFFIVGSVSWYLHSRLRPDNVLLFYEVGELEKTLLAACADAAINPMFKGSGTNLKLLEYMAMGLPVVATPVGARGVADLDPNLLIVAQPEDMAGALQCLLADEERQRSLAEQGRRFIRETFDWNVASAAFRARLSRCLESSPRADTPD
ncbi:MAG: hypothetical protein Kow0059_04310 [Candidatus Sumerlaeia bacterium]